MYFEKKFWSLQNFLRGFFILLKGLFILLRSLLILPKRLFILLKRLLSVLFSLIMMVTRHSCDHVTVTVWAD